MSEPRLSFIILTRNRREHVARAVQSVASQQYSNKEIIVVDNGSADGTVDVLRRDFPDVTLVANGENVGSAAGRNRGIAASKGKHLIFLDDDCVLADAGAAAALMCNFEADPTCGAIALRIHDPLKEAPTYDVSGAQRKGAVVETVRFCSGGFAARRKALNEAGGFYEPYFMVHADTDLALRMGNARWRIILRGDIEVYHPSAQRHQTPDQERRIYYNVRNGIWLALRLLRPTQWLTMLLPKILRAFLLAFRSGRLRLFARGLVDGFRRVRVCLAERRPLSRDVIRRARRLGVSLWM